MPRVDIRQMLVLVSCIYTAMTPITVALSSNISASVLEYDVSSTRHRKAISGLSDGDAIDIICPNHCTCFRKSYGPSVVARCNKLIDEMHTESNIEHLILENVNNITLGPHEFRVHGLARLESIEVINCQTTIIDRTAFDGLLLLNSVRLRFNKELFDHQDMFQTNSQLKFLNINEYYQSRNSCDMSKDYLFDAPSVIEFSLSVTNYKCWSPSTFIRMPSLTYLKLERLNLKLAPGMFTPLRKLAKLEMRHMDHINIVKDAFNGTNLHTLILAYSVVTPLANIQIARLKHLHIEYNSIKNIGKSDFIGLPALEKLELINSDIETIHEDAFSQLTQLKYLNIGGNKIMMFSDNHLRNNYQLDVLLMAYNENLKSLPVFKLNSTDNNNYAISEFDCCSCGLESIADGTFNAMPALTRLTLKRNYLKTLPHGLFRSLSSLKSLDLSENLISNIPDDMFEGGIKLTQINLAENTLTTLRMTPFLQTPELSGLDVSQCQIKIWTKTSAPLNSLRFLSLHGNKLQHIAVAELKTIPHLSRLRALHNPIKCDNEFKDTIKWLELQGVETTVDIPTLSYCDSQFDKKSCWSVFQKVICNPNQIFERNCSKNGNRNGYCINHMSERRIKWAIGHWRYDNLALLTITLIGFIVIIIAISIIMESRPRMRNIKKCNSAPSTRVSFYKPLDTNGCSVSHILARQYEQYFSYCSDNATKNM